MNIEKLDEAIAYIEAHPEEWRQLDWFYRGDGGCGTAACLAGTVALLDGWKPKTCDNLLPLALLLTALSMLRHPRWYWRYITTGEES